MDINWITLIDESNYKNRFKFVMHTGWITMTCRYLESCWLFEGQISYLNKCIWHYNKSRAQCWCLPCIVSATVWLVPSPSGSGVTTVLKTKYDTECPRRWYKIQNFQYKQKVYPIYFFMNFWYELPTKTTKLTKLDICNSWKVWRYTTT